MADSFTVRIAATNALLERIDRLKSSTNQNSPAITEALTRASLLIVAQAKINIRRKRIVDTGRLLNSIRYEFSRPEKDKISVLVGSFGVPYAAMHEFGGMYPRNQMRAMFATLRQRGKLKKGSGGKGIMQRNYLRPRPYLRPAFIVHKDRVQEFLLDAIEKASK